MLPEQFTLARTVRSSSRASALVGQQWSLLCNGARMCTCVRRYITHTHAVRPPRVILDSFCAPYCSRCVCTCPCDASSSNNHALRVDYCLLIALNHDVGAGAGTGGQAPLPDQDDHVRSARVDRDDAAIDVELRDRVAGNYPGDLIIDVTMSACHCARRPCCLTVA